MKKVNTVTNTADNNGEFTDGNAAAGIKPTELLAGWFNTVQRELVAVVEDAGEHLDPDDDKQISKIIRGMRNFINHYRNYGYPEWENSLSYYEGAVVYYYGDLYLSLRDNNLANIPGTNDSIWQPYIQREATASEALEGTGSTQVMSPRRVKTLAEFVSDQLHQAITPYLLPVGSIIMWSSVTPPDGWLELNGQTFDTGKNPRLAALYPSGRVPDWRGRFVRAWAHGSTIDPDSGRAIGSLQEDAIRNITGKFVADVASTSAIGKSVEGAFYDDGPLGTSADGGNVNYPEVRKYALDASRVVPTAEENRPKNVAAMFIIKTDKAESEAGAQTPSALVVSPATITMNAGTSRQFSETVLPSSLAAGYPVSWAVSDPSLGSINSSGLYTASAGKSGMQTIIASISTGLTATATVTQHIYLTSITIGDTPAELLAGNTYMLAVTYSPTNYTENVSIDTTDSSVATLLRDGTLTIYGGGAATLSLTGESSGVTNSITVTATEKEVAELYLAIENNLSEIGAGGKTAQAEARENIGVSYTISTDAAPADAGSYAAGHIWYQVEETD